MVPQIDSLTRDGLYQLRRLRATSRSITTATVTRLVTSLMVISTDYCNSYLVVSMFDRVQSTMKYSTILVECHGKCDHDTLLLLDNLNVLRVQERLKFKCCFLYKTWCPWKVNKQVWHF